MIKKFNVSILVESLQDCIQVEAVDSKEAEEKTRTWILENLNCEVTAKEAVTISPEVAKIIEDCPIYEKRYAPSCKRCALYKYCTEYNRPIKSL